jgi:hypothetical protein
MPSPKPADAISLLKADHRKVENLFEQFEKAKDNARNVGRRSDDHGKFRY